MTGDIIIIVGRMMKTSAMKNKVFCVLVALFAASTLILSQSEIVKLAFDADEPNYASSSQGLGNLLPVDRNRSIANFGHKTAYVIDNHSGALLVEMDHGELSHKIRTALESDSYWNRYRIYDDQESDEIPTCSQSQYSITRFFRIDDTTFACELAISVLAKESLYEESDHHVIYGVAFTDNSLQIKEFYLRDLINNAMTLKGGHFIGRDTLILSREVPIGKVVDSTNVFKFVMLTFHENKYRLDKILQIAAQPDYINYYVSTFYNGFKKDGLYCLFNGESIYATTDFDHVEYKRDLADPEDYSCANLVQTSDSGFVGLITKIGEDGDIENTAELQLLDGDLRKLRAIHEFDLLSFTINSLEYMNGHLYLLLFDRRRKKFLMQTIDLD